MRFDPFRIESELNQSLPFGPRLLGRYVEAAKCRAGWHLQQERSGLLHSVEAKDLPRRIELEACAGSQASYVTEVQSFTPVAAS